LEVLQRSFILGLNHWFEGKEWEISHLDF
jgi:hypothetical protein